MLYNAKEIAKKLNISIVTAYAKLKLDEIKPLIINKNGKAYVDVKGLEAIKQSLKYNQNQAEEEAAAALEKEKENLKDLLIETLQKQVEDLTGERDKIRIEKSEEINHLKEQLNVKDQQIATKDKHVENMQILLKQEQDKTDSTFALPEFVKEHDVELVNTLMSAMEKQKELHQIEEQNKKKKSFFNNIFGLKA